MKMRCTALLLACVVILSACGKKAVSLPERRIGRPAERAMERPRPTEEPLKEIGRGDAHTGLPTAEMHVREKGLLPDAARIDERLETLLRQEEKWNALDRLLSLSPSDVPRHLYVCRESLEKTIAAYRDVRNLVVPSHQGRVPPALAEIRPWDAFFHDIAYLEKGCGLIFDEEKGAAKGLAVKAESEAGRALEPVIIRYADQGRYQDAATLLRQLQAQGVSVSTETRKQYGRALLAGGRLEDAAETWRSILAEEGERATIEDRILLADIFLAIGRRGEARSRYEEVVNSLGFLKTAGQWAAGNLDVIEQGVSRPDDLIAYEEVLKMYLASGGRLSPPAIQEKVAAIVERSPESPMARNAVAVLRRLNLDTSAAHRAEYFKTTSSLAGAKFDGEPEAPMEEVPREVVLEPAHRENTENAGMTSQAPVPTDWEKRIDLAGQEREKQWGEGMKLLESRQYDEAVVIFRSLLNTEYDGEARQKVQEAVNHAAGELRKQAAAFYVQARKTNSPAKKEELLVESWRLLDKIKTKYPSADIIGKVDQNIQSVEEQLRELNPSITLHPGSPVIN